MTPNTISYWAFSGLHHNSKVAIRNKIIKVSTSKKTTSPTDYFKTLLKCCASVSGFTVGDINSRSRKREIVMMRQIIMYQMYLNTNLSFYSIGKMFAGQFDHATVLHARKEISYGISIKFRDTKILAAFELVKQELESK